MSDSSAFGFGKFVPGFDFLQSLARSTGQPAAAGGAIPGMSSWVAPTLSVEELDKRIQELKAVQFWLEQNGTALKATIQALEVQKMTLTTLQGMNVNLSEMAKAFTAHAPASGPATGAPTAAPPTAAAPPAEAQAAAATPSQTASPAKVKTQASARSGRGSSAPSAATAASVDPMQWWGSLTQQFQNIASAAMQDVAAQASRAPAAQAASVPAGASRSGARKRSRPESRPSASKKTPARASASKSSRR